MDYINLNEELVKKLIEHSNWNDCGIPLTEGKQNRVEEEQEEDGEEGEHVCPLCSSHLEEEISEDSLVEHLSIVMGILERLENLNEETEIDEEVDLVDEVLSDILEESEDDEDEDEDYEDEDEDEEELEEEEE